MFTQHFGGDGKHEEADRSLVPSYLRLDSKTGSAIETTAGCSN